MSRRIVVTLAAGLVLGAPLQAQQGRADLRYGAPQAVRITYSSVDSMSVVMAGLPVGGGDMTGHLSSLLDLEIEEKAGKLSAKGTVREVKGSMSTMMGDVPLPAPQGDQAVVTIPLTPTGPDTSALDSAIPDLMAGGFAEEAIGKGRVALALVLLPGRTVRIGESWTDTITAHPEGDDIKARSVTVMTGTYVRDTTFEGRAVHVLQVRSTITMTSTGSVQGTTMEQRMDGVSQSEVLWDPSRRVAVSIDTRNDMKMNTAVQGMDISMTATTVSRTREVRP